MIKELKEFLMKGNVLDLAIGLIIGGAFTKIVNSLVADILMPVLGILMGKIDFKTLALNIKDLDGNVLTKVSYGLFLQNVVDFLIVGISLFFILKLMLNLSKKQESK
jgi:large conductance mechanosensitive channel